MKLEHAKTHALLNKISVCVIGLIFKEFRCDLLLSFRLDETKFNQISFKAHTLHYYWLYCN